MSNTTRFPTIAADDMSPMQREVVAEICAGPRGSVIGPFIPLLHAPELERRIHRIGEYLRFESSLPKDVIELVVLLIAYRWTCHFEWAIHSQIARQHGLSEAVIEALRTGAVPIGMTPEQAGAYYFCSQVNRSGEAGDGSFDEAKRLFGLAGVLELLTLCGYYTTLAMYLNTARFLPEEGRVLDMQ